MITQRFGSFAEAVSRSLGSLGLAGAIDEETIVSLVEGGVVYWERPLGSGSRLALMRLFSPVGRREETFLGNVLLNDFLSKTLPRAVEEGGLGQMPLLVNDLENYYYLYSGAATTREISHCFLRAVLANLPDLYFGAQDPSRGIYGNLRRMLTFYKSNIEPFPVFAVPRFLLSHLLTGVNECLRQLASEEESNINTILAVLSFFYARDGAEMQSFHAFLKRVMQEGLLPAHDIRSVFGLLPGDSFDKDTFAARKKEGVIDRPRLQEVIEYFISNVEHGIGEGGSLKLAANLANKMPVLEPSETSLLLCAGVQLGLLNLGAKEERGDTERLPCRFCGAQAATVIEKNITGGFGAGRFCNQSPKVQPFGEALCFRCGASAYLTTKLLGMHFARPQPKAKDFPVAKQYNLIFHYGCHDDLGVKRLTKTIDELFRVLKLFQKRARQEKRFFSIEYLREEVAQRTPGFEGKEDGEWLEDSEVLAAIISDDAAAPGLELLAQISEDDHAQVLPLGAGDYRLFAIIIPQLQPGRDEALDFVQRRLSRSRLAAYTLLAFLRNLCGCEGPFYFQSVPTLAPEGFNANTFYVRDQAQDANQVIQRYSAIVNFARRVAKYREGHSLLADWILLADQLEKDPLGLLSDVLRNSALRAGDDLQQAKYRRLTNEFVSGMGVIDGTEYLKLLEHLK